MAGLQAARERGRIGGRKKGLSPEAKRTTYACYQLWEDQSRTISEVLKIVKVSRATFYRPSDHIDAKTANNFAYISILIEYALCAA